MSYFLKSGNTFRVSTKEAMDLHDTLPAGNYVVKEMPMDGPLYLEHIESFEIKGGVAARGTKANPVHMRAYGLFNLDNHLRDFIVSLTVL